jgi:predicted peptidase
MSDVSPGQWQADLFEGRPYRVLLPHEYTAETRYPLVLFLHGSAERGNDNWSQLKRGVEAFNTLAVRAQFPCIVVAPQAPAEGSFGGSWYPTQRATQDSVTRLARDLSTRRTVDPSRLYLAGLSMGAIGGWELLAIHRDLFAAAVLVCGEPRPEWASRLLGLPIWAFHGAEDTVVKPGVARALCADLRQRGSPVRWTEYPELAHESWDRAFAEPGLYPWLFAQKRT